MKGLHVATQRSGRRQLLAPASARVVEDLGDLSVIFDDAVNVAVLRRGLSPECAQEAERAANEPNLQKVLTVTPGASLEHDLDGFPHLAMDIARWAEVFGELTGCERVGVRLTRATAAMCPRLHVDKVVVRLVCTYFGAGTEYALNAQVDRRQLRHAAGDEASGVLTPGAQLHRVDAGDIVLLKGEAWPDNQGRGAVHRSPVASEATPRLVMTLDPL